MGSFAMEHGSPKGSGSVNRPRRGRARRTGACLSLCAALALLVSAACGRSSLAPTAVANPSSSPSEALAQDVPSLESLVLKARDIGSGASEEPFPGGNRVQGQVTLDLCEGSFPSEALRTGRLQVAFLDGGRRIVVSNEVVSYRAGGARQAYEEVRAVARRCPSTFQVRDATASNLRMEARDSRLVSRQLTVSALFSAASGTGEVWTTAVYQFDGNRLSGVYVYGRNRAPVLRLARRLAAISAGRLRAAV